MIAFSVLALCVSAASNGAPVELGRVFAKGEALEYKVRSHLSAERRGLGLRTWMPEDLDINYDFSINVEDLKTDGIAIIHYKRPKMLIIEGETADETPKTQTEKVNFDVRITLSPVNEILDYKDLAKKDTPKKGSGNYFGPAVAQDPLGGVIGQFICEMYRLSLFAGSFDSALDFAPKLSRTALNVGDTWHKTVGYQPQKLKGKDGKSIVRRLDYEYTYKGMVTVNGKQFQRVEAALNLDTDLSDFINDTFAVESSQTGIKKLPLRMKAKIEFNLDPVTRHPVLAEATTEGGYEVYATDFESPVLETKIRGNTLMQLSKRTLKK